MITPIRAWSTLGALSVALMVVVLAQWVAGGVEVVAPGPGPLDGLGLAGLRVMEWSQFAVMAGLVAWFVLKPLARRQELGFDGLFILAALTLNFWDPLDNYLEFAFQYNAHFLNVGSWGGFIPGWQSPGAELWVVPVPFVFGAYTWAFYASARLGCFILERLRVARPGWGRARSFAIVFAANAAISAVSELVFLQTGSIANIETPNALTIWSDGFAGWPIYNPILFGFTWTANTWLRWSRDERGVSAVERGVERLRGPRWTKTALRFLAISAFTQVAYIGLYFVPWNLLASLAEAPPPLPSYFPVP